MEREIQGVRRVVRQHNSAWIMDVEQFGERLAGLLHDARRGNRHPVAGAAGIAAGLAEILRQGLPHAGRFRPRGCGVVEVDRAHGGRSVLQQPFVVQELRPRLPRSQQVTALAQSQPGLPLEIEADGGHGWELSEAGNQSEEHQSHPLGAF